MLPAGDPPFFYDARCSSGSAGQVLIEAFVADAAVQVLDKVRQSAATGEAPSPSKQAEVVPEAVRPRSAIGRARLPHAADRNSLSRSTRAAQSVGQFRLWKTLR